MYIMYYSMYYILNNVYILYIHPWDQVTLWPEFSCLYASLSTYTYSYMCPFPPSFPFPTIIDKPVIWRASPMVCYTHTVNLGQLLHFLCCDSHDSSGGRRKNDISGKRYSWRE